MEGKRPHAVYCTRACKTKASDRRRVEDGREAARNLERYEREADHRRAYAREYLQKNPEKMREVRLRRKGRLKTQGPGLLERDWIRLCRRYGGRCAYCDCRPQKLTQDHVIPLSRGGNHSIGNILPACTTCNSKKKTKFIVEWRRGAGKRRG